MSIEDIYIPKMYSYELHPGMLEQIAEAFDLEKAAAEFAEAVKGKSPEEIEKTGQTFFENFGRDWMKLTHKLGDEYPDRTYEVLREVIDQTDGYYAFALLPQRFIEIAYLAVQDMSVLPIVENNHNRLIYRVVDCKLFRNIKEKCGEDVANMMTCRNACLSACETIHQDLEIDANISMDASIPKDGYCEFAAKRA